jgi:LacI family transcriptional regulator
MSAVPTSLKLTQKQIAEHLGVSRQLVGFALSGQGKVAESTRQKILEVARQNGYDQFSNPEARLMISKRYGKRVSTGLLAVLFASNFENQPLAMVPYFTPIFRGLELEAKACGLDLMLCPIRPEELPRLVRDRQLDGVICLSVPHEVSREIAAMGLSVVNIQSDVAGISCVLRDDFGGGLQAARHLVELGHREIAYLGCDAPSGVVRHAAFCQVLKENGIAVDEQLVDGTLGEPTQLAGEMAMRTMLERSGARFSAIVAHNDLIAMGAIRALQESGLKVPEDVSVIGFDDVADQYGFKPSLTSICFAREAMGRRAVEMLMEITATEASSSAGSLEPLREVFSTRLVLRDSTRAARSGLNI